MAIKELTIQATTAEGITYKLAENMTITNPKVQLEDLLETMAQTIHTHLLPLDTLVDNRNDKKGIFSQILESIAEWIRPKSIEKMSIPELTKNLQFSDPSLSKKIMSLKQQNQKIKTEQKDETAVERPHSSNHP